MSNITKQKTISTCYQWLGYFQSLHKWKRLPQWIWLILRCFWKKQFLVFLRYYQSIGWVDYAALQFIKYKLVISRINGLLFLFNFSFLLNKLGFNLTGLHDAWLFPAPEYPRKNMHHSWEIVYYSSW